MRYTVRPISDHTWLRPETQRTGSQFDSTWSATLDLLGREVDKLRGRDLVIEIDVREQDIRNDGMLRANARPSSSAVVVAFESKHGPMLYRSDRYATTYGVPGWQHNVRAVAKTLEALRAVDRYGATETGQQYAGFKAIGGGATAMPAAATLSVAEARARVLALAGEAVWPPDPEDVRLFVKRARRAAHPDLNGGDHEDWRALEAALKVLGLLS